MRNMRKYRRIEIKDKFISKNKGNKKLIKKANNRFKKWSKKRKLKKIKRCKRSISRNRDKVKWCRRHRHKFRNPGFVQRYNKAVKRIQFKQDELRRLRMSTGIKANKKQDHVKKCTFTRWKIFNSELKTCRQAKNRKLCLNFLKGNARGCWIFFKSMNWIKMKKFYRAHQNTFHPKKIKKDKKSKKCPKKKKRRMKSTFLKRKAILGKIHLKSKAKKNKK